VSQKVTIQTIGVAVRKFGEACVSGAPNEMDKACEELSCLIRQYGQNNSVAERERCLAIVRAERLSFNRELMGPFTSDNWESDLAEIERRINSGEQPS